MPADTTMWNAKDDNRAGLHAYYHPTPPSTDVSTTVTDAWATHDFYSHNGQSICIVNHFGTEIPHSDKSYETGDIGDPTTVIRHKYYPSTVDEKAILDAIVARGDLVYETKPTAPA